MGAAVAAAAAMPAADLPSVRALGDGLATLPTNLQVLEAASNSGYSTTSSAHMAQISLSLSSASSAFTARAADELRLVIAQESHLTRGTAREAELKSVILDIFRGRPLRVTELRLTGTGPPSLFASLRESTAGAAAVDHAARVMGWMDFGVRLFTKDSDILASDPSGRTFFGAAVTRIAAMVNVEKIAPPVVADFFEHRLRALEQDFRDFLSGKRLLRPSYSVSYLEGPVAMAALAEIQRSHVSLSIASEVARQLTALQPVAPMAPVAPVAPAAAAPAAAAPRGKRPKKARAAAATAAAPAVAPAPAPPVAAPAAPPPVPRAPAAPAAVPVMNANGVIGGAPFVGRADAATMHAFSQANPDVNGQPRCFNFWRRGTCRQGQSCNFSHL
jgi:hypothetical protein